MLDSLVTATVTVLTAIIGVAVIAVILSRGSNTTGVLGAGGSSFAQSLGSALSPITGASFTGGGVSLAGSL